MAQAYDGRRDEAALIPLDEVVSRLNIQGLRRNGPELTGPCPVCGGRDRFSVHVKRGVWNCRICAKGGDGLALVQHVMACDFPGALDFLCGAQIRERDPVREAQLRRKAEEKARRDAEAAARYRARAIEDALRIWRSAGPGAGTPAEAYLAARGIRFPAGWPPSLRFLPHHAYQKRIGKRSVTLHSGPCMIAAVQAPTREIRAVHQTWIDPTRPGQKAAITDPKGAAMPAKMVRGSKKGGAIRLSAWSDCGRLVMGEGIETTASIMCAGIYPSATYWAGVDLGNMGGRQTGRNTGAPDLADAEAFVPPEACRELVFLMDGDSDPAATEAKLLAGIRRAKHARPGLSGLIVRAPAGADFNDVWREMQAHDAG